ncbi:MAG: hypothetical protein HC790_11040, partial [Acaryochloridaceae cyanobacterium CSU_3_4]|nr:hypothetical protein [Acaryochloridaceae cyanobacterium CSU_3_4]
FALCFDQVLPPQPLKDALQQTLIDFYPVAGVLHLEDNTVFIQQQSKLVDLEVIEHPDGQDRPTAMLPSELAEFYLEVKAELHTPKPLARFCLHQFHNGSVLVVNISHCLVDGYSFFYFLSAWAKVCRGESYRVPCHDRHNLIPNIENVGDLARVDDFDATFSHRTGLSIHQERQFANIAHIEWESLLICNQELDALRQSCHPQKLSDNSILCAYLWKKYAQHWHHGSDSDLMLQLTCAIDFRRIYRKVIPLNYFGNAIKGATCVLTLEQIQNLSLVEIGQHLQLMVLGLRTTDIEQHLSYLEAYRHTYGMEKMSNLHVANPDTGLLVTNLSRLSLAELNFGQGSPLVLVPLVPAARVAVILPIHAALTVTVAYP